MKTILVTGASGQLGQCFQKLAKEFQSYKFLFCSSRELDITSAEKVEKFFNNNKIDYCINTAAYTNVEQAEIDKESAYAVNDMGAGHIAQACSKNGVILFHFSTDYVFNGKLNRPYKESDEVEPISVYGASKLAGEERIASVLDQFFIFRTSWLYSEFGHNFYKTILKKAEENAELNITTTQMGTPTNANDLAHYVLNIIESGSQNFGIYNFSNQGEATWYDFALEILSYSGKLDQVTLNKTGFFKTLAERPEYSVLSKDKAMQNFGPIKGWKESLHKLIDENPSIPDQV